MTRQPPDLRVPADAGPPAVDGARPPTDVPAPGSDGLDPVAAGELAEVLAEVPCRRLLEDRLEVRFSLAVGDRPLAEPGASIAPGDPLVEHVRDRRLDEVGITAGDVEASAAEGDDVVGVPAGAGADRLAAVTDSADAAAEVRAPVALGAVGGGQGGDTVDAHHDPRSGDRWAPRSSAGRLRRGTGHEGELLIPVSGQKARWRIVTGEHRELVASPVGGEVLAVHPGGEIRIRTASHALRGAFAAGTPARGRLELATDPFGELRAGGIDVGRAGSILVVGSRIDAEALTRARAMGVRGIVVATLPGKELRDFRASERRQRASLHAAPPFAVLVLEGALRRRLPTPIAALLERLEGRDVAVVTDPPALVFDAAREELPGIEPDWVRVRSGPNAGAEGRVLGLAGLRRFARGVQLEAALVALGGDAAVALPLADLERFA